MAVELWASVEFARWFEWISAADPPAAQEVAGAADDYAAQVEAEKRIAFDVCSSPSGRMAFVAAHAEGVVFLASAAEIEGSPRRTMILVSRARKVVRRLRQARLELFPWAEVRKSLRGSGAVNVGGVR